MMESTINLASRISRKIVRISVLAESNVMTFFYSLAPVLSVIFFSVFSSIILNIVPAGSLPPIVPCVRVFSIADCFTKNIM